MDEYPERQPALRLSARDAALLESKLAQAEEVPCVAESYPDESPEWAHGMFSCPLHDQTEG